MTITPTLCLLGISFAIIVWLCGLYRTERQRIALVAVCLGMPRTSDWWQVYSALHRLTVKMEKTEDN